MQLFYRELGAGKPLIILHGLFGSSDNWLTISKRFAENNKVYLIDLRNHGQSPKSDLFNYEVMAQDILHFIDQHQLKNISIIGHSMGGKVAMVLAQKYADKIDKLIVADIAPKSYPVHHDKILEGLFQIDLDNLPSRQEADKILAAYIPELGVRQFLLKNLNKTEDQKFEWRVNLDIINKEIENIGQGDFSGKFNKPTLFLRGAKSNYIKDSDFEQIYERFPQASIKTIENVGHWLQAEAPEVFYNLANEFLEKG